MSGRCIGDSAYLSEVGSVSLSGGLGGSDLVSSSGTSVSSESNVGSGRGDLESAPVIQRPFKSDNHPPESL